MMDEELCILCEEGFNHENPAVNVKEKELRTLARKDSWMICTGIRLFVRLVYEQGMLND